MSTLMHMENKIGGVNVVDNLTSDETTSALSAKQGKLLDNKIDEVDNEVDIINNNLTTTYETVTTGIIACKYGKIVTLIITLPSTTLAAGWNNIYTLPEKYRPKQQIQNVGYDNSPSTKSSMNYPIFQITTSGVIRIYKYSDMPGTMSPYITLTYVI